MKIYNTLTKRKEEFVSIEKNKVKIYWCGSTVYDHMHIGNARTHVVLDVVRRYLEYKGYEVITAQNFTDVDDKIIKRAVDMYMFRKLLYSDYILAFRRRAQPVKDMCRSPNFPPAALGRPA